MVQPALSLYASTPLHKSPQAVFFNRQLTQSGSVSIFLHSPLSQHVFGDTLE